MNIEKIVLNEKRNSYMVAYTQSVGGELAFVPKRPAIVVIPGGGYAFCSDREGEPIALYYAARGYQAFVLYYSIKEHAVWRNPLDDYDSAVDIIKSRADEWGVYPDKIACVGFSAGGHLAACAASVARNKPSAAILVYPAITEELSKICNPTLPSPSALVDCRTAPCMIVASRTDKTVDIGNAVEMQQALAAHHVPFECHIYSHGPHGFSTARPEIQPLGSPMSPRVAHWMDESMGWLEEMMGGFGVGCMTPPAKDALYRVYDDDEYLSADCTLEAIANNAEGGAVIEPLLSKMRLVLGVTDEKDLKWSLYVYGLRSYTLREATELLHVPNAEAEKYAEELSRIKNTK